MLRSIEIENQIKDEEPSTKIQKDNNNLNQVDDLELIDDTFNAQSARHIINEKNI